MPLGGQTLAVHAGYALTQQSNIEWYKINERLYIYFNTIYIIHVPP